MLTPVAATGDNGNVTSDSWPLTGRDGLIGQVLGHLADPACDGVYLVGESGVGTTRLLDEILARLRSDDRRCNRVVASQASSAIPFGALAPLIPGELRPGAAALDPIELFDRIRTLIGQPRLPQDRFVCGVDDVRWLDDASIGLLAQLHSAGLATVVATIRPDDDLGEALQGFERGWSIRRVLVSNLDQDDTVALVDAALSEAVDGTTARELALASTGNPGHLSELIEGSIAAGVLTNVLGMWTLRDRPTVSARFAAMLDRRLRALSESERELLELIALAEPIAIDALARTGTLDLAVALEAHGLVVTATGRPASLRIAQPALGAQLRQRTSLLRRRILLPGAIDLVEAHPLPGDDLRLAIWRLECGLDVPAEQLEAAAAVARAGHDFESTELLARAAVRLNPSLENMMLQAEALHDLCRFSEAEAVLTVADALAVDDFGKLRIAVLRHRVRLWGELDRDASAQVLEQAIVDLTSPIAIDLARVALANTYAFSGRPQRVAGLVAATAGSDLVEVGMLFPRAIAAVLDGRLEDALAIASDGIVRRADLPAEAPIGHPALQDLAMGMVLVELGRFDEAERVLAQRYADVVAQRVPQLQTWLCLSLGRVALFAGRVVVARRWFIEARSVAAQSRFTGGLRIALTGLAVCAGHLGDAATATEADDTARLLPRDDGYLWPERALGAAWAAFAGGDSSLAQVVLCDGAEEARLRHEYLIEAELLFEAIRFGAGGAVLASLRAVAGRVDGPLMSARLAFAEGVVEGDVRLLAAAERQFVGLGARVAAAESAAQLARVLQDEGRTRDAKGAEVRSAQHRAASDAITTPRLVQPAVFPRLSGREREVAGMAATGLPSKVIAQRLGLSVRTVSNHLQNVYTKLGLAGREDLAAAFAIER